MKILITGAAGMIGSHAAEYYAKQGCDVIAYDNLMRSKLFGSKKESVEYNWTYLERYPNIKRVVADVRDIEAVKKALGSGVDAVLHAAGQPGVFYSIQNPTDDFSINAQGTFNVLEAVRTVCPQARIAYCSTNKVYGSGIDKIPLKEEPRRYDFDGSQTSVPETQLVDLVGHTPYGASKYTGDLYVQEYAYAYKMKTAVFRMSCIYGTRQFGFEDQGWLAWFIICAHKKQPITIYGNGKQVRDALFVTDLVQAYDAFLRGDKPSGVYNMGGGRTQTLSLLELLDHMKANGLTIPEVKFGDWRMFDQRVYVSDIAKAKRELGWQPTISVEQGIRQLVEWVRANDKLF